MNNEPIYEYIKGAGWVVTSALKSPSFNLADGTRAHFEARRPEPGEYYDAAYLKSRRYFDDNGVPLWDSWIDIYTGISTFNLVKWAGSVYSDSEGFVTLVIDSNT